MRAGDPRPGGYLRLRPYPAGEGGAGHLGVHAVPSAAPAAEGGVPGGVRPALSGAQPPVLRHHRGGTTAVGGKPPGVAQHQGSSGRPDRH